jgi:hypothetical protein
LIASLVAALAKAHSAEPDNSVALGAADKTGEAGGPASKLI